MGAEYPLCNKCENKTFGIYCRGKINQNVKTVFERLEEYCFCPYCSKILKIEATEIKFDIKTLKK